MLISEASPERDAGRFRGVAALSALPRVCAGRADGATIRVTVAERLVLDGQALMAKPTLRGVLLMLGYEQIGDEVPVSLDALLIDR
ncbi:hypothetical protein [Halomonas sp. NCCP-2165]|nr:hypothetical protein [Halomonas sp. NCCP-2165]GKW48991.1 hypothetical protein NCCP2165_12060 [Halomonas sp. NCCP-2165]